MEIKLTRWFVYEWGKPTRQKTPSSDIKVTTPENPLLSKEAITGKGILIPYTNLQLNHYAIPNWTCSAVTISYFPCTAPNTWLTNCANPNTWLNHQLKKDVGYIVLQFITRWRSWSCLIIKPYGVQNIVASSRTRTTWFPVTLFFTLVELCSYATVRHLLWPSK